jgi:hypothetical protein
MSDQSAAIRDRLNHPQRTDDLGLRDQFVRTEPEIVGHDDSSSSVLARRTPKLAVLIGRLTKRGKAVTPDRKECDLGVVNIVTGFGEIAGAPSPNHPDVDSLHRGRRRWASSSLRPPPAT